MNKNESTIQDSIRVALSTEGISNWRNNSGVLPNHVGTPVRFGLGNESKKINKVSKSSDLIGIVPMLIEQRHVGTTVGVFLAVECKKEIFQFNPNNEKDVAQLNFINHVNSRGGIGGFCRNEAEFLQYLKGRM